jgi:hypothetical protein
MTTSDALIQQLRRDVRLLKACLVVAVLLGVAATASTQPQVLRVRGIIVEDEAGRERILIGTPIPAARNRVRTDLERVKKEWAPQFPEEYMTWYRKYQHDVNGIVNLNEQGFDRIAIGDPVADPNIGRRIAPGTGFVVNDERGFERTGYNVMRADEAYRVVLGLDSRGSSEGVVLAVYDDGYRGLSVRDRTRSLFVGHAPPGQAPNKKPGPFNGFVLTEGTDVKHEVNVASDDRK